jgi:hypothetical protein
MMRHWGGASLVPSGTYFSEVPSTVLNDEGTVDGSALELLDEMVARYANPHDTPAAETHPEGAG